MKKLYNEFFYIPKYGKIREKAMLVRTAMTVVVMVICLAAMSITAYAYFSYNVTSGSNTIKAANFEALITVTDENNVPVDPSSTDGKKTVFTFTTPGTYTVKLEKGASTADTGFCIMYVGNEKYHTQQIGVDIHAGNSRRELVAFNLKINEPNTVVTLESHWGTSSYYNYNIDNDNIFYIISSDPRREIVIGNPVNEVNGSDDEKESTSDDKTANETTPTDQIHTVTSGENLSSIAAKYGVTVDQIAAYNEIADKNNIQAGQPLKIPPADYKVPDDTTEQTTTPPVTTTPETTTTTETTPPETTGTSEPTSTTEPGTPTTEPTTTQPTETIPTETPGTETAEQSQSVTENTETTGAPTTEANS